MPSRRKQRQAEEKLIGIARGPYPGFRASLALMRSRDGGTSEDGFYYLLPHAAENVEALIAEFAQEMDLGMRYWLLELIGAARSPIAFDLLIALLKDEDDSIRRRAIWGLQKLDSKDARRILWEIRAAGIAG